jgi:hypothetical protein
MDVWIQSRDDAEPEGFGYQFVFNLHEASRMRESDALAVITGAGREWPQYSWDLVCTSADDKFLVKGREK